MDASGGPTGAGEVPAGAPTPRVQVLVRARCPTCERMVAVVGGVCDPTGTPWATVDVDAPDTDPDLRGEFADVVPVTLVDGREVASHTLAAGALRAALAAGRP